LGDASFTVLSVTLILILPISVQEEMRCRPQLIKTIVQITESQKRTKRILLRYYFSSSQNKFIYVFCTPECGS
jgi:hypothetical protein